MQYLKIENPGVAPVEGFTILGVSTTRQAAVSGTIGKFGTGSKQAISLLLRSDLNPTIFSSNHRLNFFIRPMEVDDGLASYSYGRVCVRHGGKNSSGQTVRREEDLGFTIEHGVYDWDNVCMAMREFVANAIDRSIRQTGNYKAVVIEEVGEAQVRAKAGYTRVFIPMTKEVRQFYTELPKRFLHFADGSAQKVLPKAGRNLTEGNSAPMIYKNGVFVREMVGKPSLFDYNFGNQLNLDESRNADTHSVRAAISQVLANANSCILGDVFTHLVKEEEFFEQDIEGYYLKNPTWNETQEEKDARSETWRTAWENSMPNGVPISRQLSGPIAEHIRHKGFLPKSISSEAWVEALQVNGVRGASSVLTKSEQNGETILEPTADVLNATTWVWERLDLLGLTNNKDKPPVKVFRSIMEGEAQKLGYYRDNIIYIHEDLATGQSKMAIQTILEELSHYITGSTDLSRDFQDYAFRVAMMAMEAI